MPLDAAITTALVNFRNPALDLTFMGISFLGSLAFMLLSIIFLWIVKRKKQALLLFLAAITSWIIVYPLKFIINRPRPDVVKLVETVTPSFPSAHSLNIVLLTVFITLYDRKYWPVLIAVPFVCFSRLYLGVHFLSDVLVGAALGFLFAYLFFVQKEKIIKAFSKRFLSSKKSKNI